MIAEIKMKIKCLRLNGWFEISCKFVNILLHYMCIYIYIYIYIYIHRVSQEEYARLRESVPYVKVYRYNPKHLYPKLNGYGDNGQRILKL